MENLDFSDVMFNICRLLNIPFIHGWETVIAKLLDMTDSAFSDRKRRNSLPHNEIIILAKKNNLSLDEVYYGVKYDYSDLFKKKDEALDLLSKISDINEKYKKGEE